MPRHAFNILILGPIFCLTTLIVYRWPRCNHILLHGMPRDPLRESHDGCVDLDSNHAAGILQRRVRLFSKLENLLG